MPIIDLHTHSKFSDGTSRPSEIIVDAAKRKVTLLALSDHDTIDGVAQAQEKAQEYGIKFLTAVEVSTNEHEHLHFLGYGFDLNNREFADFLTNNAQNRVIRIKRIVEQLRGIGLDITEEEVFARAKTVVSRAHVADVLKHKGITPNRQEGFRKYLVKGMPGYVPSLGVSAGEAIGRIKAAGGKAVIAHPGITKDIWDFKKWVAAGLDGIEVFYPSHNTELIQELLYIAREHNLFVTAGSDNHGPESGRTPKIGMEIPAVYYDKLLKTFNL